MEEHISMTAIGIAVIAHFVLGFIWYTPLFGKIWAKEMGMENMEADKEAMKKAMIKGMVIMLIGNFFMAYVFSHNMAAWEFVPGMEEMGIVGKAMNAAIFTWLGFFLPVDLGTITWEQKSFKLFAINTGYHLASLVLVAFILASF